MSNHEIMNSDWQECPDGKIRSLATRLKRQDRRPVTRFAAPVVLCVLSGLLAVQFAYASHAERERINRIGGISCAAVIRQADQYILGRITGSLRTDMGFHLSNCPNCSKQVRGIAKRDLISHLLGTGDVVVAAPKTLSRRKTWCDDAPAARVPVVARKVLASIEK